MARRGSEPRSPEQPVPYGRSPERANERRREHYRDKEYGLTERDKEHLRLVGAFRVIERGDFRYPIERLQRAGLLAVKKITGWKRPEVEVVTLTKKGRRLLMSEQGLDAAQRYWAG